MSWNFGQVAFWLGRCGVWFPMGRKGCQFFLTAQAGNSSFPFPRRCEELLVQGANMFHCCFADLQALNLGKLPRVSLLTKGS